MVGNEEMPLSKNEVLARFARLNSWVLELGFSRITSSRRTLQRILFLATSPSLCSTSWVPPTSTPEPAVVSTVVAVT